MDNEKVSLRGYLAGCIVNGMIVADGEGFTRSQLDTLCKNVVEVADMLATAVEKAEKTVRE